MTVHYLLVTKYFYPGAKRINLYVSIFKKLFIYISAQ